MCFKFVNLCRRSYMCTAVLICGGALLPSACLAQGTEIEAWNAKFQATYVWQDKFPFPAAYSGPNSLSTAKETSYTFSATVYLGLRPWSGAEFYFNPEAVQGIPLSAVHGLGGLTNGEIQKTAGPTLTLYRARTYLRQTIDLGGGRQNVESDQNQLGGVVDKRRVVLTLGNLAVTDVFDRNAYAGDARTRFLNWTFLTYGAYDFAADARGYSWGLALEWYRDTWAVRCGRFLQPMEPNQQPLDYHIFRHYGDQIEIEHNYVVGDQQGKLSILGFRNRATMSRYQDAINLAAQTGGTPNINEVRTSDQIKSGIGLSLEQSLSTKVGLFIRASWADGKTETYAFTEIDHSLSGGILFKGGAWGRGQETAGVALARNGLSNGHREYLAAGGLGFFIGDGRIDYSPEIVFETFYSMHVKKTVWVSLDWQHISNPGYNADRGPVDVTSMRLHTEF